MSKHFQRQLAADSLANHNWTMKIKDIIVMLSGLSMLYDRKLNIFGLVMKIKDIRV